MTAFGSGIVYWSNHRGAPILTLLFIWAVSISYINDNHNLRQVEEGLPQAEEAKRVYARPTVAKAAKRVAGNRISRLVAQKQVDDPPLPVVVVATAGGVFAPPTGLSLSWDG